MGLTRARFKLKGLKDEDEGVALVDTGATFTILDSELGERLGVEYTEVPIKLTTFSGQELRCEEALIREIEIEAKKRVYDAVAICLFPPPLKEKLREVGVSSQVVIGLLTLERMGYAVDPVARRLIESPALLI